MRKARLFVHPHVSQCAYHIVSRVTHKQRLFGREEKEAMVRLMRRYAQFCGMRVLTFCIMDNHFHWLIEVENKPAGADQMPDANLVARVRRCQGKSAAFVLEEELGRARKRGDEVEARRLRGKYLKRMWNVSAFVQSVKQRFSHWFNKRTGRKGTLWEDRFKCVAVLGAQAVATVAAYIDLNPVRAGLVGDPKDYEFSGYGEAARQGRRSKQAREGLRRALCEQEPSLLSVEQQKAYLEWYRCWIYGQGIKRGIDASGKSEKAGFELDEAVKVIQEEGKLPAADQLAKRVRHFTDGVAVGSKELLEQAFQATKSYFGPRRRSGARKMRGGQWGELQALRDLQKDIVVGEV